MSELKNINYKNVQFTRPDGINVNYIVLLNDPTDLNENMLVLGAEGIESSIEMDLFYWIDNKRWTLNELIYFALNNILCIRISDKDGTELATYGTCGSVTRLHDFPYNQLYN